MPESTWAAPRSAACWPKPTERSPPSRRFRPSPTSARKGFSTGSAIWSSRCRKPPALPVAAVGIGCPGLVDISHGIIRFLPNLTTHWRNVPAGEILSKRLKLPVSLLNDVRTATLGELVFGHGRNASSMVFIALGTGIGGGVVIDGKLRLGPLGAAGELGHLTIIPDGLLCGCGNRGCLETLASGPAIAAEGVRLMLAGQAPKLFDLVAGEHSHVTPRKIAEAAQQGDPGAQEVISRAAGYLGIGIGNVIVTLHPEMIVLGGGVAEMGDLLVDPVREALRQRVHMVPVDDIRIELSSLGVQAGALGAVALAVRGTLK